MKIIKDALDVLVFTAIVACTAYAYIAYLALACIAGKQR